MSGKRPKKRRSRTERRQRDLARRRLVRDQERLAALEPGGAPERPLRVESPAVIEPRANRRPCPLCDGRLQILEHRAETRGDRRLRVVRARCRRCHVARELFFELVETLPS